MLVGRPGRQQKQSTGAPNGDCQEGHPPGWQPGKRESHFGLPDLGGLGNGHFDPENLGFALGYGIERDRR